VLVAAHQVVQSSSIRNCLCQGLPCTPSGRRVSCFTGLPDRPSHCIFAIKVVLNRKRSSGLTPPGKASFLRRRHEGSQTCRRGDPRYCPSGAPEPRSVVHVHTDQNPAVPHTLTMSVGVLALDGSVGNEIRAGNRRRGGFRRSAVSAGSVRLFWRPRGVLQGPWSAPHGGRQRCARPATDVARHFWPVSPALSALPQREAPASAPLWLHERDVETACVPLCWSQILRSLSSRARPLRAEAGGSRQRVGLSTAQSQSPALWIVRRACLRERDVFLHAQIRRPESRAPSPGAHLRALVRAFLFLASIYPLQSRPA
jgi:hypothetical protein